MGIISTRKLTKTALNDLPDNIKYSLFTEVLKTIKYKPPELKEVLPQCFIRVSKIKNK